MDHSLPVSSVYGISKARILEWVTISFSGGSSRPRDWTRVSWVGRWILYLWATRKPLELHLTHKRKFKSVFSNLDVKDKHILRDFLLCIACLSNGLVGFIKLGLSSIFPFKDPLQIHSIVNAAQTLAILCFRAWCCIKCLTYNNYEEFFTGLLTSFSKLLIVKLVFHH